jgi:RNA polymerase-interacting CarD/CdnL/TRCF family regulator
VNAAEWYNLNNRFACSRCRQTLGWDGGLFFCPGKPEALMPIAVHDWVVHPQHGVGRVVKLETRQFGPGNAQRYYEVAIPTGTIWVPVEGHPGGLRKLTAKRDLAKYRGLLKSRPAPLAPDHRQRQLALLERLKVSSFAARCEVVRDLTAHGWHKPLNEASGVLLRNAHHVLCAEWAAAEGLSLVEASQEVEALLLEGKNTYKK